MSDLPSPKPVERSLLLIDDDPGAHLLLRAVMANPPPVKINLLGAMSFEGGMRIIRESKPDICLLDLNFVGSEGHGEMRAPETLAALSSQGMADMVPTLIITGHIEPDSDWGYGKLWKMARMAGAVGFLRKDRYLDRANREFLLHELSDAMLEFQVRREHQVCFCPPCHVP